jgi:hypothetical protein
MSGIVMMHPVASHVGLVRVPLQLPEKGLYGFVVMLVPLRLEYLDDVPDPVSLPHGESPRLTVC